MYFNRKGFTLIELIIVVIIVGILAAIAGPMFSGNIKKAQRSEAVAACGSLRTAYRLYTVENPSVVVNTITRADLLGYIAVSDINGKYYNNADYSVSNVWIRATNTGAGSGWVNMDTNSGNIFQADS